MIFTTLEIIQDIPILNEDDRSFLYQINHQLNVLQASGKLLREGVGGLAQHPAQVGLRRRPQVSPRRRPRRRQEEGFRGGQFVVLSL